MPTPPPWRHLNQLTQFLDGSWTRLNPPAEIHCPRCDTVLAFWRHNVLDSYFAAYCGYCDLRNAERLVGDRIRPKQGFYLTMLYQPLYEGLAQRFREIEGTQESLLRYIAQREELVVLALRRRPMATHYSELGFKTYEPDREFPCPLCQRPMITMAMPESPAHAVLFCSPCRLEHYLGAHIGPCGFQGTVFQRKMILFELMYTHLQQAAGTEVGRKHVDE